MQFECHLIGIKSAQLWSCMCLSEVLFWLDLVPCCSRGYCSCLSSVMCFHISAAVGLTQLNAISEDTEFIVLSVDFWSLFLRSLIFCQVPMKEWTNTILRYKVKENLKVGWTSGGLQFSCLFRGGLLHNQSILLGTLSIHILNIFFLMSRALLVCCCCPSSCCNTLLEIFCLFALNLLLGSGRLVDNPQTSLGEHIHLLSSPRGPPWESPWFARKVTFDWKFSRTAYLEKTMLISERGLLHDLVEVIGGYKAKSQDFGCRPLTNFNLALYKNI